MEAECIRGRRSVRPLTALALMGFFAVAAFAVSACGSNARGNTAQRAAIRDVARTYLSDLKGQRLAKVQSSFEGKTAISFELAACGLETASTVAVQEAAGRALYRYREDAHRTGCGAGLGFTSGSVNFSGSSVPQPRRIQVDGDQATATYDSLQLPILFDNSLTLRYVSGHWRIDASSAWRIFSSPARLAELMDKSVPESCISSWNDGIASGSLVVPSLAQLTELQFDQSVWIDVAGYGESGCTATISSSFSNYCEILTEPSAGATWNVVSCVTPPAVGTHVRDAWLEPTGAIELASSASPDGTFPALVPSNSGAGSSSTQTTATSTTAVQPTYTDPTEDPGTLCPGYVTGGDDSIPGAKLSVYARGTNCAVATKVIADLSDSRGINHPGPEGSADSSFSVDGWTCPYGNMGIQTCTMGTSLIDAYDEAFGAHPTSTTGVGSTSQSTAGTAQAKGTAQISATGLPAGSVASTCSSTVSAGAHTTCGFAENVYNAVKAADEIFKHVPARVPAYSPTTKVTYILNCAIYGARVGCFTTNGAGAIFPEASLR
jgi:hypothetical protein